MNIIRSVLNLLPYNEGLTIECEVLLTFYIERDNFINLIKLQRSTSYILMHGESHYTVYVGVLCIIVIISMQKYHISTLFKTMQHSLCYFCNSIVARYYFDTQSIEWTMPEI